jgi:hypothetical protein
VKNRQYGLIQPSAADLAYFKKMFIIAAMKKQVLRYGSLLVILVMLGVTGYHTSFPEEHPAKVGLILLDTLIIAIFFALLAATWIMPILAEKVSEAMMGGNEKVEETEETRAVGLVVAEDYEGAITAYHRLAMKNPTATKPVLEIARLYAQKLEDAPSAVQTLETALISRPWEPEAEWQLREKMATLMTHDLHDFSQAEKQLGDFISRLGAHPLVSPIQQRLLVLRTEAPAAKKG